MSTRANVLFLDNWNKDDFDEFKYKTIDENAKCIKEARNIYIHSDMYPSGAIPVLHEFLNLNGAKARGNDSEYLSAWYVAWNVNNQIKYCMDVPYEEWKSEEFRNQKRGNDDIKQCRDFRGIGISNCIHGDVSYVYVVDYVEKGYFENEESYFDIYIYKYDYDIEAFRHLAIVDTRDSLDELKKNWWWD